METTEKNEHDLPDLWVGKDLYVPAAKVSELLLKMRDETFQTGKISGRLQREAQDFLDSINNKLPGDWME